MQLSIIIPAYNEEQSIASIISRTQNAKNDIIKNSSVSDIEIIVVNDGSQDRTKEIAQNFINITLISYENNKGYGAAIKLGFEKATGDILGFLDADGTCDPHFFSTLVNALENHQSDIAIGSRLGANSKMPPIRRLGNMIFAKIIGFLGNVNLTDSASGMRVIKRDALAKLYPLPDGLNFTPAMSCKALMNQHLKIVEEPMAYSEREGESKLHVIKDGLRFVKVMVEIALFYKPLRFLMTVGLGLMTLAFAYSIHPVIYYLTNQKIEEFFIYRLISILVFLLVGINWVIFGIFAERLINLLNDQKDIMDTMRNKFLKLLLLPRTSLILGSAISLSGVLLNSKVIYQYVTTGHIYLHWVYVLTGALLLLLGMELFTFGILQKILHMYKEQKNYLTKTKNYFKINPARSQIENRTEPEVVSK